MKEDERRRREEELDRFWDIDFLLPKKKPFHYVADTRATEVISDPPANQSESVPSASGTPSSDGQTVYRSEAIPKPESAEAPHRRFIPPHTAEEETRQPVPDEEYEPQNPLIHRVQIYRRKSEFPYYEAFLRDAVRLYPVKGRECRPVPFFSYVPQYTQMSRGQLEWYLWWREEMRSGHPLDTDYSYLLLYAYEQINLAGKIDPIKARDALLFLWRSYRNTYRQLDGYLPDWICDMGLCHRLPPPELERGERTALMEHAKLKEYFVVPESGGGYVRALLAFCSNYDYKKSKFYTSETAEMFDRLIPAVLQIVADQTGSDGKPFIKTGFDDSKMLRDAYTGALCSYRIKRKLEISYCSFSRSHELRYLVTDAIKYTENRLRSYFSVRSRLTIYALPTSIRESIDHFLDPNLSARASAVKKGDAPAEYEKQYDLPHTPLSLSAAAEIERQSWQVTKRLVDAFSEESASDLCREEANDAETKREGENAVPNRFSNALTKKATPMPCGRDAKPCEQDAKPCERDAKPCEQDAKRCNPDAEWSKPAPTRRQENAGREESGQKNPGRDSGSRMLPYLAFLSAVAKENAEGQRTAARQMGKLPDAVADEINEISVEENEDILLEAGDGSYRVIEEYRDILNRYLAMNDREGFDI